MQISRQRTLAEVWQSRLALSAAEGAGQVWRSSLPLALGAQSQTCQREIQRISAAKDCLQQVWNRRQNEVEGCASKST